MISKKLVNVLKQISETNFKYQKTGESSNFKALLIEKKVKKLLKN